MKHTRPLLDAEKRDSADAILTTGDVAQLLRVHPKHVYRLLRRGLPGHRVGGEWRFMADEVREWAGSRTTRAFSGAERERSSERDTPAASTGGLLAPALLAANGDVAVECLLGRLTAEGRPLFGHVQADRARGLQLLKGGDVLVAGCHGDEIPAMLERERLAFIRLVDRQVGLAARRGMKVGRLRHIGRWRLASRPPTAGVRSHLDHELRREGLDPDAIHSRAALLPSHREVVCAVARGEADVGLASAAWANRVGLECLPLFRETYGLLVRASQLGDPRIVRLCEIAQSAAFRTELAELCGYRATVTGAISFAENPSDRQ